MKRFICFICSTTIAIFLLSCSDDTVSDHNPFSMIEQSSSEDVFQSSSENVSSSSEEEFLSSAKVKTSSSSEALVESSSSEKVEEHSSSSENVSSSSEEEFLSSAKVETSSSSEALVESSSSEEIEVSSSSIEQISSSSNLVVGKCKTSTEDKCNYGKIYDERDGKMYKTVFMGTQEWMAENLNYSDSVASPNLKGGSWCYNNDDLNCDKYGRLYSWSAAMDIVENSCRTADTASCMISRNHHGICPDGWRLPDTTDIVKLLKYVKTYSPKSYGYDLLAISETGGKDAFGYSILNAGIFYSNTFIGIGIYSNLWTSTVDRGYSDGLAWETYFQGEEVGKCWANQSKGNLVRCIKDN